MTSPVFHCFGPHGPLCGTADGVNAADFNPPVIACKRCLKTRPSPWSKTAYVFEEGRVLVGEKCAEPSEDCANFKGRPWRFCGSCSWRPLTDYERAEAARYEAQIGAPS